MAIKIKSIDIRAFRGIPDLMIPLNGKCILIKGDNGTGKSSIVEAFEFFFTGSVSHLEGTQGISPQKHAPHVHHRADDVEVAISFDPGNIHLTRKFNETPTPPDNLKSYFEITQKGTFILKRAQLLEFITSKPAERFRALASIIGIEELDDIELEMMRARDDFDGEVISRNQVLERLYKSLSEDLGKEITKVDDAIPALNELLEQSDLPRIKSLDKIQEHAEDMLKAVKSTESVETAASLNVALQQACKEILSENFILDLETFNTEVDSLIKDHAKTKLRMSELLEKGRMVIDEEQLDTCPICGQDITREDVLISIDERLIKLQSLSESASSVRRKSVPLIEEIKQTKEIVSQLQVSLKDHPSIEIKGLPTVIDSPFLNEGIKIINDAKDLETPVPIKKMVGQVKQVRNDWMKVQGEIETAIEALGVTQKEKRLLEVIRLIGSVNETGEEITSTRKELDKFQEFSALASQMYETFSKTKKDRVSEVYDAIQGDIQDFYSTLHPDDPHTDIELRLSLGRRASTELRMKSFGREDEDPRALTSEGHLDSLGLCIFLAFVRTFNVGCSLIILDDVVTTIDSNHRRKICDLLYKRFNDFQLIITTHDGIWYEELRSGQRAHKIDGNFLNLEIARWDVELGPCIEKYLPRIDRIDKRLHENDKSGAGNDSRQYLEWTLKQIAINSNAPIPVNNWLNGTVKDLEPGIRKRIVSLVDDHDFQERYNIAISELEKTSIFGNLLSHDNILADQVSIEEVAEFFKSVRAVHNTVCCTSCNEMLKYFPDIKEYRCPNTKCNKPIVMTTK